MKCKWFILLLIIPYISNSQNTSIYVKKDRPYYGFAQIFCDFRYGFNSDFKPQAAFEFNQGIIGYFHQLSDNLSGRIIYDVTRTTHIFEITDTAGNALDYSYFEGSKYTAFLKMAEIKWDINQTFTFRIGQLLNTQYLTFIDRFWGYRYIDVTFQEKYRLGMPADFGAQLDVKIKDKFVNQFSVVNGEGPFRHQDLNGKFVYSNNIQVYPTDKITLKLYADYAPTPDTGETKTDRYTFAGFAGIKTDRYRIGAEFSYVNNYGYVKDVMYYGLSFFGSAVLNDKFQVLARFDHLTLDIPADFENTDYYLVGFQYEPVSQFTSAITFRYYSKGELPFVYFNFGLKF